MELVAASVMVCTSSIKSMRRPLSEGIVEEVSSWLFRLVDSTFAEAVWRKLCIVVVALVFVVVRSDEGGRKELSPIWTLL